MRLKRASKCSSQLCYFRSRTQMIKKKQKLKQLIQYSSTIFQRTKTQKPKKGFFKIHYKTSPRNQENQGSQKWKKPKAKQCIRPRRENKQSLTLLNDQNNQELQEDMLVLQPQLQSHKMGNLPNG